MALVFLSGAIDLAHKDYQNWKERVKEKLAEIKVGTVDPAGTFNYVINEEDPAEHRHTARALVDINRHALISSDLALIVLDAHQPSIGTPIELYLCDVHDIPSVVVWNGDRYPAYIYGLADYVVDNMDDALTIIEDYFDRVEY